MKKNALSFGEAIVALKEGKMVRRSSWPANKRFVFMQVPSVINRTIVPKMQSLPDAVKAEFERVFNDSVEQLVDIVYCDQLALVADSLRISSFSPSVEDCLAGDWSVL